MSEPIFDLQKVRQIADELLNSGEYRAYLLFQLGTGTPCELEDLFKLRIEDLLENQVNFYLPRTIPEEVYDFLEKSPKEELLFDEKLLTKIKEIAYKQDVQNFDRETMRKTFGYHYFQKTKDIRKVERALNMKPETVTFKYIGYYDETYFCFYCTKDCLW